jgi:hypothetical protein
MGIQAIRFTMQINKLYRRFEIDKKDSLNIKNYVWITA